MVKLHALSWMAVLLAAAAMAGCGETETAVELSYVRPARQPISENIKRIAIAEFKSADKDPKWGGIAADKLNSELARCNQEFNRFTLVDHRNLARILKAQDINIMNSETAIQAGKIANVQAIIYGTISASVTDEHLTRSVPDLMSRSMKEKPYTKRNCFVTVSITMTNVDTAVQMSPFTSTKTFDSEKDVKGSKLGKTMGFSSDAPPAADETISKLLDVCISEFIEQVSPHRQTFTEKLEKGRTSAVETGNKLAKEKEYADALKQYLKGIGEDSKDDGACFNAGLMCEATLDFAKAEEFYTKAIDRNAKDKYIKARQRVRAEKTN